LGGITPRALSVSLYADSKRLEWLLGLFSRLISRAERQGVPVPDLSSLGRSFPETMIAGRLVLENAAPPLVNASGMILGLPLESVLKIRRISVLRTGLTEPECRGKLLTVENKETFYALAEDLESLEKFDCLLYAGGHPNNAVRALLSVFTASNFALYHAGDLDPDGILILQELAEIAGKPVVPVGMSGEVFKRYAAYGRPLEQSALRRVSLIHDAARRLPGIAELIKGIGETGLGIEQEIIDYRSIFQD
jgi:hypothetical protein